MIITEDKTLLKDKKFLGVFGFGLVCAMIGVIVRIIFTNTAG